MSKTAKAVKRTIDVHDEVDLADTIVTATDSIALAQATIADARVVLEAKAADLRREASYGGVLVSTIHVRGSNRSLSFDFRNQVTQTSTVNESRMREDLGPLFEQLFTRNKTVKMKEGALDQVRALLGDRFNDLFETVETVGPRPEFRETIHALRQQVDVDTASKLDNYEAGFCAKPALKVMG